METTETVSAVMAMTSDRVMALAVAALCVAAASMVWSIVMIVRVAVDGYGFRKRSSISSTNVPEHAPLSAGACVDNGVDVETTGEHENRAADGGCRVSTCSDSSFRQCWWILRGAWRSGGFCYRLGLVGFGTLFLAGGAWMLIDLFWGVGNPLK